MNVLRWSLLLLTCAALANSTRAADADGDDNSTTCATADAPPPILRLSLGTYNIQHIPVACGTFYPPCRDRLEHIPRVPFFDDADVWIFQEAFVYNYWWLAVPEAIDRMRSALSERGYDVVADPILYGRDKALSSGVAMALKTASIPRLIHTSGETYGTCCGLDCLAGKGFFYATWKEEGENGPSIGVIGTHLQASDCFCKSLLNPFNWFRRSSSPDRVEDVQRRQVEQLAEFVDELRATKIAPDVLVAVGDWNIDRESDMHRDVLLPLLRAQGVPTYGNGSRSIDPERNSYARATNEKHSQHLDYGVVLLCPEGRVCALDNQVMDGRFPLDRSIGFRGDRLFHLSDHDPVILTLSIS